MMYYDYKVQKRCFRIIAAIIIWGLLCPQVIWGGELPYKIEETDQGLPLVSFEKFEEMEKIAKELLGNYEDIEISQKDELEIKYKIDENGELVELMIIGDEFTAVLSNFCALDSPKSETTLGIFPNKGSVDLKSTNDNDDINTVGNNQIDNDEFHIADIELAIADKESSEPLKISIDKSDNTDTIKINITILLKIHESAMKKFYTDVAPYYSKLESELRKAQWLWWEQGIDPHLYYAGGDGILDDREIRRMVEESVDYLYKNIPDDLEALNQRSEILQLEKNLRTQYVDPALELYKRELKEASSAFYKSVEDIIKPLISPFINKVNGEIEVIITLPKESLK